MLYKKLTIDLIVPADEAEAVIAGLNASLDVLEDKHTLFGGGLKPLMSSTGNTEKVGARAYLSRG